MKNAALIALMAATLVACSRDVVSTTTSVNDPARACAAEVGVEHPVDFSSVPDPGLSEEEQQNETVLRTAKLADYRACIEAVT